MPWPPPPDHLFEEEIELYVIETASQSRRRASGRSSDPLPRLLLTRSARRAARKPFEQNVADTKGAVEILKSIRPELLIEGGIGYIGASSEIVENVPAESLQLTTSEEAAQFVAETKVDVLAPAVGNMHCASGRRMSIARFTPSRIGESTSQIARTLYFVGKVHR
jgi:hypothetical protein